MSKSTPELSETERHILQALSDESDIAEDEEGYLPVLDYWEGDNDWNAAKRLVELGLVRVDTEDTSDGQGHLVLRESHKGSELLLEITSSEGLTEQERRDDAREMSGEW